MVLRAPVFNFNLALGEEITFQRRVGGGLAVNLLPLNSDVPTSNPV